MTTCVNDQVAILHGHNRWVLARTDRDAPTAEDVRETAGAFLSRVLGRASPTGQRSIFEPISVPGSDAARYVIGAARPVEVQAAQPANLREALALAAPVPGSRLLGRYTDCPVQRAVTAQRPWIVTADFDWRAPDTLIPWPTRRVNALGFPSDDPLQLDWLLMGAAFTGGPQQSDTTLMREVSAETRAAIRRAGQSLVKPLLLGAVGLGFGYGMFQLVKHTSKPKRGRK